MKTRVQLLIGAGLMAAVAACGGPVPQTMATPEPIPQYLVRAEQARADSIAAIRAAEQAKARTAEARFAERRRADSLAAVDRASEQLRLTLAETIHFDFDRADVRPGDAGVLDRKVLVLKANPAARIQIAGNCDERGSDEYNLALGNRRAISAQQYLMNHGVDARRIETVSYGKERPLDPGHNEAAWATNRNDEFEILTANVVLRQP
jgi:peptidoglycan-associated lipoprotein